MTRLTPWYPPHIKPVHFGVYNASYLKDVKVYREWSRNGWSLGWIDSHTDGHIDLCKFNFSPIQNSIHWRGIADEPKGEGK